MIDNVVITPVTPTGGGDDTLTGGAGNDALYGGVGNDTLRMGNADGVQDRAIYDAGGFGNDTITQFENGTDVMDMRGLGLTFSDVNVAGTTSAVLTFTGVTGQITLYNFAATNVDASDFFFV